MSNNRKKKAKKTPEQLEIDAQSAKMFGKHASKEKRTVLLIATLLACAAPMLLGARLWNQIPEIVPSGLIGSNGEDDSIPRWMVAFGLSGLMCLLNFLSHFQLKRFQKKMSLPPVHVRLMGRWGFPILSVIFCTGMIRQSVGGQPLPLGAVAHNALGLLLMLLGAHMYECPRDARIALRLPVVQSSDSSWNAVHKFAGLCWLAAGLVIIILSMISQTLSPLTAVLALGALVAPVIFAYTRPKDPTQ